MIGIRKLPGALRFIAFLCFVMPAVAQATRYEKNGYHYEIGPASAWVRPASVPAQWDANAPGAAAAATETWRTWLDDVQIDRRGGGCERHVDTMYEPLSSASLGEAGRFQFVFHPEYETLTIHRVDVLRDGKWSSRLNPERITLARRETDFESDMATGVVTALLDIADVRLGDVIRVSYTIKGANPVLAGLDYDAFEFGWINPVLRERMRVLFDDSAQLTIKRDADAPEGQLRHTDAGLEYQVEARDMAAVPDEGDYPGWYSSRPMLKIARKQSWADIAAWAVALYPAPRPLPADLEARIAEWKREPDPAKRAAAALHAVQDEVRYFGIELGENSHRPAEPADVWMHRQGDCKDKARLLVAILAQLDIPAQPALVSSNGGSWTRDTPPSASAFDHVIVRASVGGHSYWMDPTRTGQRGSLEQAAVSNFGFALPVAPETSDLVAVTPGSGSTSQWRITENYRPSADAKTLELDVSTEANGQAAEQLCSRFASVPRAKIQQEYADYYSRRLTGLSKVEPLQMQDDTTANKVTMREGYVFNGALALDGGVVTLDTYAEEIGNFTRMPKTISRRGPLALAYPVQVEERIVLTLPPEWAWRGAQETESVVAPGISYSQTDSQHDREVVFLHQYHSTAATVAAGQVKEHLGRRHELDDLLDRRFVLLPPDALTARQRDERLHALLEGIMEENNGQKKDPTK